MNKEPVPGARFIGTVCAAAMFGSAAMASPTERAIDVAGLAGAISLAYGDHTVNAALASISDIDSYTFAAQAGDKLLFHVHSLSPGLDPVLQLRDTVGNVVGGASCNGFSSSLCSAGLTYTAPADGTYTVNMLDSGANEAGAYEVHLDEYPPRNNWMGVQYSSPVNQTLGHTTDVDNYAFWGRAGTRVNVTVGSFSGGLDLGLAIFSPQGDVVGSTSCNGFSSSTCSSAIETPLLNASGIYTIVISDVNLDEVGNYALQVSCVFGNCPLPQFPAPPVPEPSTWALMLGGCAALGALVRRRRR